MKRKVSIVLACAASIIALIGAGMFIQRTITNRIPVNEVLEERSSYQEKFKEKDYVQSFLAFTDYISKKDMQQAWSMLSSHFRSEYTGKEKSFQNDYALTSSYEFFYFIPLEENRDNSSFYVWFKFTDKAIADELRKAINYKLSEANTMVSNQSLVAEIERNLSIYYKVSQEKNMSEKIESYLADLSINTLTDKRWMILSHIANHLNLSPIEKKDVDRYWVSQGISANALSKVVMVKENKQWKVEKFETIMKERWK